MIIRAAIIIGAAMIIGAAIIIEAAMIIGAAITCALGCMQCNQSQVLLSKNQVLLQYQQK